MASGGSRLQRVFRRVGAHWVFALVFGCVAVLPVGFFVGSHSAHNDFQSSTSENSAERARLEEALDTALGEIEMLRTRNDIDSRALEMLRREMAAERERTAELEEGLAFYRSLVVSETGKDIYLRQPELAETDDAQSYAFRIFVHQKQQKEREFDMVEGALSVMVVGTLRGQELRYSLTELSPEFSEAEAKLHFRYFQAIEGELSLPEGFEPREMVLEVAISKPRESRLSEVYPWQLQERFIHVGE